MRFTRLRLNGFKSFVDPTDLVVADGLTGVVGPNGCGKSNLLEALRWVMGENRPTAMRGGGMEDVIFAGAASRPGRHFAEVSLSIDNSQRLAPAGFNDADHIDVVRRITREAGSAYKVNGRDVRARDVQMLFADASTGAHSPALVRQGQIAELIAARPTARRRILEEAAGISGLYQRRHEAELKLKGAETNLTRVDDLLEQLAAQIATLARQARQAAKYREIGDALRRAEALLLLRRWQEADAAQEAARRAAAEALTAASGAERASREATARHATAQEALAPLREEATIAAAVLQRLQVERDQLDAREAGARRKIAELRDREAQIGADIARETELNRDATESLARLEAEAAELAAAGDGHDARLAAAEAAAQEADDVLAAREADHARLTDEMASLIAHHRSSARLVEEAGKARARAETEAGRAETAAADAAGELARADTAQDEAMAAQAAAARAAEDAADALAEAEAARLAAQADEADARAARSAADGAASALGSEVAALDRILQRDEGAEGQLLDSVAVAPGWELALGAALADDLRAPATEDGSGWAALPDYAEVQPLPDGTEPIAAQVTAPAVLLRRLAQIGVVAPEVGARLQPDLQPGQRLVSREGDLWRWDGLRRAADQAASATSLRLQQRNRLEALRRELAEAEASAATARAAHEDARHRLDAATEGDRRCRGERKAADEALVAAGRRVSQLEAARNVAEGRRQAAAQAAARHRDDAAAARARLAEAEAALARLGDPGTARAEVEDVRLAAEAARITMLARRSELDEVRRAGEARAKRLEGVGREISGWRQRLATAGGRVADLEGRKAATERDLVAARRLPEKVAADRERLGQGLEDAEGRRRAADDALAVAETAERDAARDARESERAAGAAREGRAAANARAEAAQEAAEAAERRLREETGQDPAELAAALGGEDAAPPPELEARISRLRGQRDALGAVNLRAEEDARAVKEEHAVLAGEKADLESAIAALRSGIAGLNREGRERLLTAFEQVDANFGMLFAHLFGGGEARLELVESDDPLEAGLEILCQPPGKKLSTLSLLSGGEQTLTALALIFAVFLANPAPICVLDEVDAPLDDANVGRFCDLLDEMTRRTETRFLIITHHAVTMARMDRLFGVTMGEAGVSQLVSVDLRGAESLVA